MSKFSISPATSNDIRQLTYLVNNAYRGEQAKKGWTHEADLIEGTLRIDETSLRKLLLVPFSLILKCTDENNRIIGCVYLENQGAKMYLGMLSVLPEMQAHGIGKLLLLEGEAYAQKHNCTSVVMTVISVRHELIEWYKRRGYEPTGDKKPFLEDKRFGIPTKPIEFIVMEKKFKSENFKM